MSTITTHVLDTSQGRPASGIAISLERSGSGGWEMVGRAETDGDGRVRAFAGGGVMSPGAYRLTFQTGPYFQHSGRRTFYPEVVVTFEVVAGEPHYHVPLLISAFGYSTYRGS